MTNRTAGRHTFSSVQASKSGAKVTVAEEHKVPIKKSCYFSTDFEKGSTKPGMIVGEAMLASERTETFLSVRAVYCCCTAGVILGETC